MLIDLSLREQAFAHCLGKALIGIVETALYIGTGEDGFRGAVYGIRG